MLFVVSVDYCSRLWVPIVLVVMAHVEDLSAQEDIAKARHELADLEQQLLDGTISKGKNSAYSIGKKKIFDGLRGGGHIDAVNVIREELDEQEITDWIAANRKTPFIPVKDPGAVLGDGYVRYVSSSQGATVSLAKVPATHVSHDVTVVPNQGFADELCKLQGCCSAATLCKIDSGEFLKPSVKDDALRMAELGRIHAHAHLGRVDETHPAFRLEATINGDAFSDGTPVYALYASRTIKKLQVVGLLAGKRKTGLEFEEEMADQVSNLLAGLYVFDLESSLQANGGWVPEMALNAASNETLVLDYNISNELKYTRDFRDDPLNNVDAIAAEAPVTRRVNAAFVELIIDRAPHVALVTIKKVRANEEIIVDHGEDSWIATRNLVKKAAHVAEINRNLNQCLDKVEELESDHNPMMLDNRDKKDQITRARTAAVLAQDAWEDCGGTANESHNILPLWQPGTLDSTVFDESIKDERK
eukprot:COSAG02_NODE_12363_length_1557_cov_3.484911_1_plen_473_part_01